MFEGFSIRALSAAHGVEQTRKLLGMNWHRVEAIKNQAVERALKRRKENKQLAVAGDNHLPGRKFQWLADQENLPQHYSERFEVLRNPDLKEFASGL
jgi:hypothetical protein